jgi:MFS family permease
MYLDRACMGAATPMIMREFHLNKIAMGWSASAFNWAYELFQIPGGWLADRFGSRIVLAGAIAWWRVFTAATGRASSAIALAVTVDFSAWEKPRRGRLRHVRWCAGCRWSSGHSDRDSSIPGLAWVRHSRRRWWWF